ncbi:MAG: hypothetical protein HKN33_13930 [Pyrinomonadaceae bacterium]|nr:hypothetical protein [Pyrinomonadaceae bacterium]
MRPRTKRQREIFDYISEFVDTHGHDPSYTQIAQKFEMNSKGGIAKHIAALESQGLLARRRENGRFRLELNPRETIEELICRLDWLKIPEAIDYQVPDYELVIPKSMTGVYSPSKLRGFVVMDNSMSKAHIREGDIAIIEKKEFARDRDTVVACHEAGDVIMSVFRRSGADIEFIPANDNYEVRKHSADRIEILGVYRGLLRPPS